MVRARRQGLLLVPKLILAQLQLIVSPKYPNLIHGCIPRVLKLSSDVNECTPLLAGSRGEESLHRGEAARGGRVSHSAAALMPSLYRSVVYDSMTKQVKL